MCHPKSNHLCTFIISGGCVTRQRQGARVAGDNQAASLGDCQERSFQSHLLLLLLLLLVVVMVESRLYRIRSLQDDFDAAVGSGLGNHSLLVSVPPRLYQLHEALFRTDYNQHVHLCSDSGRQQV